MVNFHDQGQTGSNRLTTLSQEPILTSMQLLLTALGTRLDQHALFINTLSLLEYMGSRKIMKSQVDRVITSETLSHMAEEIRHAQVLKILALKFSQQQLSTYHDEHLLCGGEAKAYIQTVDRAAEAALQHASLQKITHSNELNYLFTTLLVEERAAQLYPLYNEVLGNLGHPNKLQGIVREEQQHLDTVTAHLKTYCIHDQLPALRQIEIEAFDRWQQAILQRLASC